MTWLLQLGDYTDGGLLDAALSDLSAAVGGDAVFGLLVGGWGVVNPAVDPSRQRRHQAQEHDHLSDAAVPGRQDGDHQATNQGRQDGRRRQPAAGGQVEAQQ